MENKLSEIAMIVESTHGTMVAQQAEDLLNDETRPGMLNGNAVALIKSVADKYDGDEGVLGEQAELLLASIDEYEENVGKEDAEKNSAIIDNLGG